MRQKRTLLLTCDCNVSSYHRGDLVCHNCGEGLIEFDEPHLGVDYAFKSKTSSRYYVERCGRVVRYRRVTEYALQYQGCFPAITYVDQRYLRLVWGHAYEEFVARFPSIPATKRPVQGLAPIILDEGAESAFDGEHLTFPNNGRAIHFGTRVAEFIRVSPKHGPVDEAEWCRLGQHFPDEPLPLPACENPDARTAAAVEELRQAAARVSPPPRSFLKRWLPRSKAELATA